MEDIERPDEEHLKYPPPGVESDRPLGDLLKDFYRNSYRLLTQEIELAKLEMSGKASKAFDGSKYYAFGVLVTFAGFLLLLAALTVALSQYLPLSLAALVVGAPVTVAGLIIMWVGRKRFRAEELLPGRTLDTLKGPFAGTGMN